MIFHVNVFHNNPIMPNFIEPNETGGHLVQQTVNNHPFFSAGNCPIRFDWPDLIGSGWGNICCCRKWSETDNVRMVVMLLASEWLIRFSPLPPL